MQGELSLKARTLSIVAALGIAAVCACVPATAFAVSTDGYVTAAATRAAGPAPEILGLSGVEESGQFVDVSNWSTSLLYTTSGAYQWTEPKYVLEGTSYNTNANPYFLNLFNSSGDTTAVYNAARAGAGAGPDAALASYGTDSTDDAVWNLLPDVIIGTDGGAADYTTSASEAAAAEGSTDYNPTAVTYSFTTNANMVTTMYAIAAAADTEATETGDSLRYGSAMTIAENYEKYVKGTQGYILEELAANSASKKTVALVTNAVENSAGTYTYTLASSTYGSDGTASTNRYLETCEAVSNNLADTAGTTVQSSALQASGVSLVMVGGQSSSANYSAIMTALTSDGLLSKSYYVANNGSEGAMYGVVMNSVENAQNIGRILGCLYPEYVDQDDFVAYYYDNFYHISSSSLATVMDNALDGVRNWDATGTTTTQLDTWTTTDASTYSESAVQAKLDSGISYIKSLSTVPSGLELTSNI